MRKTFLFPLFLLTCIFFILCSSCSSEKAPSPSTEKDNAAAMAPIDEVKTFFPDEMKNVALAPAPDPTTLSEAEKEAFTWCNSAYQSALKGSKASSPPTPAWSEIYSLMSDEMDRYYRFYLDGGMTRDQFSALMESFSLHSGAKGIALGYIDSSKLETVTDPLKKAGEWVNKGNFLDASLCLAKVEKVSDNKDAKDLVQKNKEEFQKGVTEAVTEFMVRWDIEKGKTFLNSLSGLGINSHLEAQAKRLEAYRASQEDDLVECNVLNTLENLYSHCLIAFPEINFASEKTYRNCGDDCLTVHEFKAILNSLYEKGYIIVDANLFYDQEKDAPVNVLKLPKGKKPLLLTFDDVTYDSRKDNRGMVDKLILDESGRVCTWSRHADGKEVVSYDNEIFPIVDAFVREHPDFTFHGGRGTLFFTGFDGICGYRTQLEPIDEKEAALGLDRQEEIRAVKPVIEAMRKEGWTFGSHSYGHGRMPTFPSERIRSDTNQWLEEVGAIVGKTGLFCWPYGGHTSGSVSLRKNEDHKFLFDSGFNFFFGCGAGRYLADEPDGFGIFTDRKAITGEILYFYRMGWGAYEREYSYLFDPDAIWDPLRKPYENMPPFDAEKNKRT